MEMECSSSEKEEGWIRGDKFPLPSSPHLSVTLWHRPRKEGREVSAADLDCHMIALEEVPRQQQQQQQPATAAISLVAAPGGLLPVVTVPVPAAAAAAAAGSPSPSDEAYAVDSLVSDTYDDADLLGSLPFDVRILCYGDGEPVLAHRFVLVCRSAFFRARFRAGGGASLASFPLDSNNNCQSKHINSGGDFVETVDLSSCPYASAGLVRIAVKMLYKGCFSVPYMPLADFFPLMYLADFLQLPFASQFCQDVLTVVLARAAPDLVMLVTTVAGQLRIPELQKLAETKFLELRELPLGFEQVSWNTIKTLVEQPERTSLDCLSTATGLSMYDREKFLLDLVVRYLRHDPAARVPQAVELLQCLRLAYVAHLIENFESLGLPELDSDAAAVELLEQARHCSRVSNFYQFQADFPSWLWVPRRGSMKYSFWTNKRFGNLRYRCLEGSSPEETARIRTFSPRKIKFQREGDVRISAIEVSVRKVEGQEMMDGLALEWSDGSRDAAGGVSVDDVTKDDGRSRRFKVELGKHEGVIPCLVAGDFVRSIMFVTPETKYGPESSPTFHEVPPAAAVGVGGGSAPPSTVTLHKGTVDADGRKAWGPFGETRTPQHHYLNNHVPPPRPRLDSVLGSSRDLAGKCFLDGVKGVVVSLGPEGDKRLVLTSLHFKLSVLVDGPLEHLSSSPKAKQKQHKQQPDEEKKEPVLNSAMIISGENREVFVSHIKRGLQPYLAM